MRGPLYAITRRAFLRRIAFAGGAFATVASPLDAFASPVGALPLGVHPAGTGGVDALRARTPVVTFVDGQLWLDSSGASRVYEPPIRSASASFEHLTDEELWRLRAYI